MRWRLSDAAPVHPRTGTDDARDEFPQQLFTEPLYEIYYRFLETDDEYFDYAPAKIPSQGRWRIYSINLTETILRRVYFENALVI